MPKFAPFRAIRYAPGTNLDLVIAPPYDVLSDADVMDLALTDPHNIVRVDEPARLLELTGSGVIPPGEEPPSAARACPHTIGPYAWAARLLSEWLADGVLIQDAEPSLTIYRMSFTDESGADRVIVGLLGGLEVVDEGAGGVLPHEQTTPKAKTDRLDLTRATGCNLSPVWGLSLASGLTDALVEPGEVLGSMTAEGVLHSVERVSDPARIARLQAILASDDVLIADGHHRYAISRTYRDEVRAATGRQDTEAEYTLAFVNELIPGQLSIAAIHRLYSGVCLTHLRAVLGGCFDFEPAPEASPETLRELVALGRLVFLHPDGATEWMIPKAGAFTGVRNLDGALLEHALAPLAEPQTAAGAQLQVTYQHGLAEVKEALATGRYSAGVLIRPTSITEIERTAREGLLMPPKSTFFTPKLRTGLVIRPTARLGG
ncbi:MAG: DUF1015 domain-containing protein [Propionibacteriaceae bacterium]|jgi:uncharacterized protein (DUF1015 family)|nr:DUF1015 domain-containing protein [Propionibacteriaceae bacterium]